MSSARGELGAGMAIGAVGMLLVLAVLVFAFFGRSTGWFGATSMPHPFHDESAEAAGLRMALGPSHGRNIEFERGSDRYAFAPGTGEFCESPVVSSDGRSAYAICSQESAGGRSWSYSCILHFEFSAAPLKDTRPTRLLDSAELSKVFGGRAVMVAAIARVSSSRRHLLLIVRGELRGSAWTEGAYWYDLDTGKVVEPDR